MTPRRWFRRRMGQDVRAWPMLALLLLVVLVAIGCVLWFMREAMRNERLAVQGKVAEAYRGQLALLQRRAEDEWTRGLARFDEDAPAPGVFVRSVREGWADSAVLFDAAERITYPQPPGPPDSKGEALQVELRTLVQEGKREEAIQFVLEKFSDTELTNSADAQGRLVAANAELLALDLLGNAADPRHAPLAERLRGRVMNYDAVAMPSAQRRFLMRELGRLAPGVEFPTFAAEELAARYLEAHPAPTLPAGVRPTGLPELWEAASPGHRALALFSTKTLQARLDALVRDPSLPIGVRVTAIPPGDDLTEATLVTSSLAPLLPGWRLALSLENRAAFDTAAERRAAGYLWIGCAVVAAMAVLAVFIARGFGQQVRLARLKNDLVATVSHELKTPLTAMRALVDTLLDTERFDEKTTREYLQLLAAENTRLSRLIENFLTFSRLERNKFRFEFRSLRPEQVVNDAVTAFGERAGCALEVHSEQGLSPIHADADALVTALLNLLDNACKYSGDEKRIALRTETRNGCVRFAVEDHGIGLTPREQRRIFGRFYQVDQQLARTAGGCGLGLSIVSSIVAAHRGTVSVASEVGRGSTFTIELPATAS